VTRVPCHTTRIGACLIVGLTLALAGGCPSIWPPDDTETSAAKLLPFSSADELLDYFQQQARARNTNRWAHQWMNFGELALFGAAPAGATQEDSAGSAEGDGQLYSTTNVQETGVDEADVVKSDGTYFYIARGTSLRVVRADPAEELAELARLDLDVRVSQMYLNDAQLLLLAQRYEPGNDGWDLPAAEIWPPYYTGAGLTLIEVDLADRQAPAITKQVDLDGVLVDSRLVNGRLILVLTVAPDIPDDASDLEIDAMSLEAFMPQARSGATERNMVRWQNCLHPASPDGYFMTAVLTLDVADIESILHSVAVVAGAGTIYASPEALYTTDTEYGPASDYREMTAIHKFAFDEDGAAQYVASGSVPGRLLNQFSLGEHEGYLRVATHVSNPMFFGWGTEAVAVAVADTAQDIEPPNEYNAVYVLAENGVELETVGAVEDIAPDEDLYSARFVGDHGFVVTYYQVDPLFVLDLTDPTAPQVVGELKVPGFSEYLHPLDDTHLIGVGRATEQTDEGFDWFQGVQVSLFDVSDWSNPTAVEQLTLGGRGSSSEVEYTHKGFTLLAERGLLAIPMRLYTVEETPWEIGELEFDGVVCLQVDAETGFSELGRLEAVPASDPYRYRWSELDWRRAAFIDNTLYAISADGVAAAPLEDISDATALELEE
jgi:uncharacterized secreted protein with C-terminal beta-propeller domain